MSVDELSRYMRDLGTPVDAAAVPERKLKSPLSQAAFYNAVQQGVTDAGKIKAQFIALRDEAKKEQGFLSKTFSVFSHEKPMEKVLEDLRTFEKYCHKNGITFDEVAGQMVAGPKPKTVLDKMKEFRFLIAAAGGTALGLAGINPMGMNHVVQELPGMFFQGLPYVAVPFIGLNLFNAFTKKSVKEEVGTFVRFGTMMLGGFLVGVAATTMMAGHLPHLEAMKDAVVATGAHKGHFSPFEYVMHVMAGGVAAAGLYKMAKARLKSAAEHSGDAVKSGLSKFFDKASGAVVKAGQWAETTASNVTHKVFTNYMNYAGAPAIALMMANTFSKGLLGPLQAYAGYYETVLLGMGICAAGLSAALYGYGVRSWKDVKAVAKNIGTAFSTSSGVATIPTTLETLKTLGVSRKTRESVTSLSANFNMLGTSQYLGTTVFAANRMFGYNMGIARTVAVGAMIALHGYGVPGEPASNLTLLAPVLGLTGLATGAIQEVYNMVTPGDRLLDMLQTSINVWGDIVVALGKHRREVVNRAKHIKSLRDAKADGAVADGGEIIDAEVVSAADGSQPIEVPAKLLPAPKEETEVKPEIPEAVLDEEKKQPPPSSTPPPAPPTLSA